MNEIENSYAWHAYDSAAVNDWIMRNGGNVEAVRASGSIAEMRGRFVPCKRSHMYGYQFEPDPAGAQRAIVVPVIEDGAMVDIIAWRVSRAKLDVWGCVTHTGRFLNGAAIYDKSRTGPLEVCEDWRHWLWTGCNGVLPLRVEAMPDLTEAGDLLVDHASALRVLYEAFLWPLNAGPDSQEWQNARAEGRRRIYREAA